ncbi:MAG: LuxR C-terminal-related transcriptional regulator [Spirochaetes bacterium]|nr:LuxR C-terminal-related transcriptional regulator [Spirochaetota bacterium]
MKYLSALSMLVASLSLLEGIYVFFTQPRNSLNRTYFYMTLCIAVWLFGASFAYSGENKAEVWFWFRICSFGFIFLHAFTLHFVITLTRPPLTALGSIAPYLLYLPSFYFQYKSLTDSIVFRDFLKEGNFWTAVPAFDSPVFLLLILNYLLYYLVSAFLLIQYARRVSQRKEKTKAWILFSAILSTIFFYNLEPFLLPYFTEYKPLVVSPLFSIVWITLVGYAILRYRFLSYTPSKITQEILDGIDEAVLVFDSDLRFVYANAFVLQLHGKDFPKYGSLPSELSNLFGWFPEYRGLKSALSELLEGSRKSFSCVIGLRAIPRKYFQAHFSSIRDPDGSNSGVVFIGKETVTKNALFEEKRITRKEERVVEHLMKGETLKEIAKAERMGLRTVKTHCAHIYQKLGVKNRVQLLELFHTHHILPEGESERKLFLLSEKRHR